MKTEFPTVSEMIPISVFYFVYVFMQNSILNIADYEIKVSISPDTLKIPCALQGQTPSQELIPHENLICVWIRFSLQ